MLVSQTIGLRIKELRKKKNLSQALLSEKIGVSRSLIAQIETNSTNATLEVVTQLVTVLDTSLDYLILGVSERDKSIVSQGNLKGNLMGNPIGETPLPAKLNPQKNELHEPVTPYDNRQIKTVKKWEPATVVIDPRQRHLVSLVEARAAAGYARHMGSAEFLKDLPVLSLPFPDFQDQTHICIQVTGNSMESRILHMDYLIASQILTSASLRQGEVYVIVTDDGIQVKRFRSINIEARTATFSSDHSAYGDLHLPVDDIRQLWESKFILSGNMGRIAGPASVEDISNRLHRLESRLNGNSIAE